MSLWVSQWLLLATVCNILFIHPLDKKKKKEESKVLVRDVKEKSGDEEKKKEKPKAHAPSHAKIRSIGKLYLMSCDVVCTEC